MFCGCSFFLSYVVVIDVLLLDYVFLVVDFWKKVFIFGWSLFSFKKICLVFLVIGIELFIL